MTSSVRPHRRGLLPSTSVALLCIASLYTPGAATADVRLDINGLTDELEDNVRAVVGKLPEDEPRPVRRFARDLEENARIALSALGYYAAEFEISTDEVASKKGATEANPDGLDAVITLDATPNNPVLVNDVNLEVTGPAKNDTRFKAAIEDLPLKTGDVFLSSNYEEIKSLVANAAQDLGYFDLDFPVSTVSVSRQNLTADVDMQVASGERFTFGKVLYNENVFAENFLDRWLSFAPGDDFDMAKISETTVNLRNSGYFDSVRVIPQRDDRYGKVVPVSVTMEKKDNNLISVGIGFATDIGPRFSLAWEKPLINRFGHSASVDLQLSEPRQSIAFEYQIPRENKPLTNYWSIDAGLLHEDFDDDTPEFTKTTVAVQRVSQTTHDFQQSIFLRWERETTTITDVDDTVNLVLPGISYARSRSKGKPHITWGQSEKFTIYGGSDEALSTIDFLKTTVNFRYVRSFWDKNSFIGSFGLGWIESNDFERVPGSQRFFAGGDRSVRGFRFRDISPRNLNGDAVGGRYLEEFTVEYNRRFRDQFRWAVFVDAGRAFNNYDTGYSAGAGAGIRWESPVGPFRLDVATPISDNDGDGVRFHLSIGTDL